MTEKERLTPGVFDPLQHIQPSRSLGLVIEPFYPGTTARQWQTCLSSMKKICRVLSNPSAPLQRILLGGMRLGGLYDKFHGLILRPQPYPACLETIRVLMDENLTARQKFGLVVKEMRIGFANGLLLGAASFGAIGLFIWVVKGKGLWASFAISGCIGVSLLLAMVLSSAVGPLIPLFFKKIHVDPAVASGPLITTVNDLVAVVSYYGLSWILLLQVMHLAG